MISDKPIEPVAVVFTLDKDTSHDRLQFVTLRKKFGSKKMKHIGLGGNITSNHYESLLNSNIQFRNKAVLFPLNDSIAPFEANKSSEVRAFLSFFLFIHKSYN